jgi:hypothetical protein
MAKEDRQHVHTSSRSPTFVAVFADGVTTRMSCHCPDKLDLKRGIKLSRVAYEARKKTSPPEIIGAYFESDGKPLRHYDKLAR